MRNEYTKISELISKQICFGLNNAEKDELQKWIEISEENSKLYNHLIKKRNIEKHQVIRSNINISEHWSRIEKEISPKCNKTVLSSFLKYAATIVFITSISIFIYFSSNNTTQQIENISHNIHPGTNKAILYTSEGDNIVLGKTKRLKIQEQDGTHINNDSAILRYSSNKSISKKELFNKIEVPTGGEYSIVLSDGSKVFINSESVLRFPVAFTGSKRIVYLKGEAYFKVAKDKSKPFIVKTDLMDVAVTGTEFNIKAYKEDKIVQTTLVEGGVNVRYGKEKKLNRDITPSQQAEYKKTEKSISIKDVNVNEFIAWRNGQFFFRGERLEDIMKVLSRWYNINVFFQNSTVKDLRFTGRINKYENINPILEIIEFTQKLNIEIKGNTIILKEK